MRTDKELAFELRKTGKSYMEISKQLKVAKSTLSNWFKGVDFSEDIKKAVTRQAQTISAKRLIALNTARGDLLRAHYIQAEVEALKEIEINLNNPLFVSGIATYWGEGDKSKNGIVRLANTDPQMIILFIEFLLRFGSIPKDKLRGAIYIYEDLDADECKKYWSRMTGLVHFHKTMVLPSRHKIKKLPYGTFTVLVNSTYFKKKLLFWIDHLPKMVLNTVLESKI